MEFQKLIIQNIKSISLLIYVIFFTLLILNKPIFLFNGDGSVKEFGLNNINKTVLPLWLIIIGIAILSYMGVLYYLAYGFHRY
jgi:hypothetical protein